MRVGKILRSLAVSLLAVAVGAAGLAAMPDIYPGPDQATSDLAAALQSAATTHRRVIVDFGGNWCPDCYVLDGYLHDAVNKPFLDAHFVLVHVNIGMLDQNLDIAGRYEIPLKRGVPALAVLEGDGRLLYSQKGGEFEAMRRMQSSAVTQFLKQWMGAAGNN
jgi:thioredoxin-like negative regulator of GroEL